jgi:hypothetical protein
VNFDLGIDHLVPDACDCGPYAFPVQWVSVGALADGGGGTRLFCAPTVLKHREKREKE